MACVVCNFPTLDLPCNGWISCVAKGVQRSFPLADEGGYIAVQEKRADELVQRVERMQNQNEQDHAVLFDRVEETSNELSRTHDYAKGLH